MLSPVCGDVVLSLAVRLSVAVVVSAAFLFTVNFAVAVPFWETIPSVCSPAERSVLGKGACGDKTEHHTQRKQDAEYAFFISPYPFLRRLTA